MVQLTGFYGTNEGAYGTTDLFKLIMLLSKIDLLPNMTKKFNLKFNLKTFKIIKCIVYQTVYHYKSGAMSEKYYKIKIL